jgi:hypothetical protein
MAYGFDDPVGVLQFGQINWNATLDSGSGFLLKTRNCFENRVGKCPGVAGLFFLRGERRTLISS